MSIKPLRIRSGTGYTWCGLGCIMFAIFAGLAATGGSESASAFSVGFSVLGTALIALGFWRNLFSKLEERLMDIESAVRGETPAAAIAPAPPPSSTDDPFLG